jgi:hypothetical protein
MELFFLKIYTTLNEIIQTFPSQMLKAAHSLSEVDGEI